MTGNERRLEAENAELKTRLKWAASTVLSLQAELEYTRGRLQDALAAGAEVAAVGQDVVESLREVLA